MRGAGDLVANEVEADTREVAAQKKIAMGGKTGVQNEKKDDKNKKPRVPGIPSVSKDNVGKFLIEPFSARCSALIALERCTTS